MSTNSLIEQLYQIQTNNPPSLARLPASEVTYDINLEERLINSPKFLSTKKEHKSETIYFRVDRFYDYVDLSTTTCIIQYKTAQTKTPRTYIVPFFDIATQRENGKMLIPWCIDGAATSEVGLVEYSLMFYRIAEIENERKIVYRLNTQPAKSEVLYTLDVQSISGEFDLAPTLYEDLIARIDAVNRIGTYWTILD